VNTNLPNAKNTVFAWNLLAGRRMSHTCLGNFSAWAADGTIFVLRDDEFVAFNPNTGDEHVIGPAFENAQWIDTDSTGKLCFLDTEVRASPIWDTVCDFFPSLRTNYDFVKCDCCELSGRIVASVPTTRHGARDVSPEGQVLAVSSPTEPGVIDLYDL